MCFPMSMSRSLRVSWRVGLRFCLLVALLLFSAAHGQAQQTGGGGVPGSQSSGAAGILRSPSASQSITQPTGTSLQMNNVFASPVNNVIYVDGVSGGGIGVATSAWSSSTAYPLCSQVSYSGGNYLGVAASSNVTPGTNPASWYPVPNAATPTQLDCAFYIAASQVVNHNGAAIRLGAGTYQSGIGLVEPTVSRPGDPIVNIYGAGRGVTTLQLNQNNGDGFPFLYLPDTSTSYAFASFDWRDFTIDANFDATAVIGVYGAQQFVMKNIAALDATDGSDHAIEFGDANNTADGWVFEPRIENVDLGTARGFGTGAIIATTVSGGVPSFTVTAGGSGYNSADTKVILGGTSNFGRACSSAGTTTATINGSGVITAITSTATGCVAPIYTIVYAGPDINYGYKFSNVSDGKVIDSLTNGGVGWLAGMYLSDVTDLLVITKYHPESTLVGVQNYGSNDFIDLQCDTIFQYCIDQEGAGVSNYIGNIYEWNNANMTGSRDWYFGAVVGVPGFSEPQKVNIYGEKCGNPALQPGYAHFDSSAGVVDSSVGSDGATLPPYVKDTSAAYCNIAYDGASPPALSTVTPDFVGDTYTWTNGAVGNTWNYAMTTGPLNGGCCQTMTLTNPASAATSVLGEYSWIWGNSTPATSSNNYGSPGVGWQGNYWNGTASTSFGVNQQLTFAAGSNPLATYAFTLTGTTPSGGIQFTFPGPLVLPNGSTTTTQTAGDNSTKVATDAFVVANAPAWSSITAGANTQTGAFSTAAPWTLSAAGAASTPGLQMTGAPYTAGSATTAFPLLYLNDGAAVTTFSTAGEEFGINAPSGFVGHFLNFFVNGNSTRFRVDYAGDLFAAGTATISSTLSAPALLPSVLYSAAGTALPTCASGLKGQMAVVSDATSPSYMGTYTSGGAITAAVICSYNGSTYSWLTH